MAKLFWRYGSMGAGKTAALLSVAYNYSRIGRAVAIYTAALDNRFGEGVVASRMGTSRPAELFTPCTVFDTANLANDVACVLIDEAQFLSTRQVGELHRMAALGNIPVIAFGLRSDFRGEAFEGAAALATVADEIEELKTVCACGRKATFQIRMDEAGKRVRDGDQVQIGGDAQYRQTCAACFYSDE